MAFWFDGIPVTHENPKGLRLGNVGDKQHYNLHNAVSVKVEYLHHEYNLIDSRGGEPVIIDDADKEDVPAHRVNWDLVIIRFVGDAKPIELIVTNQTAKHIRGASGNYAYHRSISYDEYPYGNEMNPYVPDQDLDEDE